MDLFEHRYIIHISFLSILVNKKRLLTVLKIAHRLFPNKTIFVEIKTEGI